MNDNTFHLPEQLRGNFEIALELHQAIVEIFPECQLRYEEYKIKKEAEEERKSEG